MNKLISAIAIISLSAISFASAGIKAGISVAYTALGSDGTETIKDSSVKTTGSSNVDVLIPALFFEAGSEDRGIFLGIDYTDVASLGSKSRDDGGSDTVNTARGENTASADVESLMSIYAIKTLGQSGLFVKLGYAQADIITKEQLTSGSTYGNKSVSGVIFGAGIEKQDDSGYFFRVAGEYIDYDGITLTGSEAGGTATSFNTITAEVDSTALKISVGKSF
jgi:hypothetical protein